MSERLYSGSNVPQEAVTFGVPVINSDHEAIHLKYGYSLSRYAEGVADDAFLYVELKTPTVASGKIVHLKVWRPWGEGGLNSMEVVEAPTFTTGSTSIIANIQNRNRYGDDVATAMQLAKSDPTSISVGTVIDGPVLFGGGGAGGGSGGSLSNDQELVLEQNTTYIIRLKNLSGAAKAMGIWLFWYEENR